MAAETLAPAPRSRRERIYEGLSWLNGNFALMGSTLIGHEPGLWQSILVTIVLTLPGTLFFAGLAMQERKARLAGDLERGLIECAIRRPHALPGSLQGRWKPGYAQVQNGTIRFQTLYAGMDEAWGSISTFTDLGMLKPVPMHEKRPPDLKRRWKIVGMTTDKGALELASDEASLRLLESRRG